MTTQHIQTLIILADRARQSGLIQFNEMAAVLEAVNAAQEALKAPKKEETLQQESNSKSLKNK